MNKRKSERHRCNEQPNPYDEIITLNGVPVYHANGDPIRNGDEINGRIYTFEHFGKPYWKEVTNE